MALTLVACLFGAVVSGSGSLGHEIRSATALAGLAFVVRGIGDVARVGGLVDETHARRGTTLDLMQQAAANQHPKAMAALAALHDRGLGLKRDPDAAARLFLDAARLDRTAADAPYARRVVGFSRAMRIALQERLKRDGFYSGPTNGRTTSDFERAFERAVIVDVR